MIKVSLERIQKILSQAGVASRREAEKLILQGQVRVNGLLVKDLVKVVGKKDDIGKPALYGTTTYFLELFNLKSIKDIPSLRDLEEIEQEFKAQASLESVSLANAQNDQEDTSPEDLEIRLLHLEKAEQEEVIELEDKLNELRKLEKDMFPSDKDSTKVD